MAKHIFQKTVNMKIVGILDKDDEGNYFVTVEDKDNGFQQYDLNMILSDMVGHEINLSSVDNID